MKKHLLIASLAVMAGCVGASAQVKLVKEAEQMKNAKASEVLAAITPAFSDPETAELAQTYFVPGKAFFKEYDNLFGLQQFNQLPEGGNKTMADDVLQGYELFVKALPLDTVVDAKGKVKTKYSKEILATITGHVTDFNSAAIIYWELKDYDNAYNAWDIFLNLYETAPFAEVLAKSAPADTVIGEVYFNQALAAWQADKLDNALKAFGNAKRKGYNQQKLYDYAIAVASSNNDPEAAFQWATDARAVFGDSEPNYLGNIVNYYLQKKDFDNAFQAINQAIDSNPNNAQYYFVKGILFDNQDKKAEAKEMYIKALELDPNNTAAMTQYGVALCQEAYALNDAAPTNPAEYQQIYNEKIKPLFEEAAEVLEKAWALDYKDGGEGSTNNQEALRYLENIYYNLGEQTKQDEVKDRMLY